MKKFITNKITLTIFGIIAFLLLWWIIALALGNNQRIFPDPWSTIYQAFLLMGKSNTYLHLGYTFLRMLIGFVMAALLGIFFGVIVGNYRKTKYVFNPTMIALKSIPTAALVFLFLVLIGAKNAPIFIVSLISFPIIYEAVAGGYANIDKGIIDSISLEKTNLLRSNILIKFPLSLPYLFVGLASSFALAFKIEIMAEVISGSTAYGIGNIIRYVQQNDASDLLTIFAYSFIAVLFMFLLSLISYLVKNKYASKIA